MRTITGASTGFYYGGGLRIDAAGSLYVVNALPSGNSATFTLLGFPPTASGNVAPALSFTSTAWNAAGSELAVY